MAKNIDYVANDEDESFVEKIAKLNSQELVKLFNSTKKYALESRKTSELTEQQKLDLRNAIYKMEADKVRTYPVVIINQTLVLMCASLDMFLSETLRAILDNDPNSLKQLCAPEDIKFPDSIELALEDKLVGHIKNQILKRFEFGSINQKLTTFTRCKISLDHALPLSFMEQDLSPKKSRQQLITIYHARHDIAHKGKLPLKTVRELQDYGDFFVKFMFRLSNTLNHEKALKRDLDLMVEQLTKKSN